MKSKSMLSGGSADRKHTAQAASVEFLPYGAKIMRAVSLQTYPEKAKPFPDKKPPAHSAGGFCDRVYKPGSVIDSHLSRRIVAGALQPPPRKQPGRPCFLHGVAPDRVYSNGRFHADACALTARFHPYLVGANFISFASPQAAKLIHSVAPPLPSKQGLCRLFLLNWETLFSVAQLI